MRGQAVYLVFDGEHFVDVWGSARRCLRHYGLTDPDELREKAKILTDGEGGLSLGGRITVRRRGVR